MSPLKQRNVRLSLMAPAVQRPPLVSRQEQLSTSAALREPCRAAYVFVWPFYLASRLRHLVACRISTLYLRGIRGVAFLMSNTIDSHYCISLNLERNVGKLAVSARVGYGGRLHRNRMYPEEHSTASSLAGSTWRRPIDSDRDLRKDLPLIAWKLKVVFGRAKLACFVSLQ
jgi:hypothetical protein